MVIILNKCEKLGMRSMEIETVYREIAPKLQSYLMGNGCSYATACDIVQETFLRIWKQREKLSDDLHQVSGLAFTIARNCRNDLSRKAQHEILGDESSTESQEIESNESVDEARPGEVAEENDALRRRLKASLKRMPVQLLETFALSRLGKLSMKDIANETGTSEANVKVRVHRAKEMFRTCFQGCGGADDGVVQTKGFSSAVFKAMMMLAAVDGEISREELSLYRKLSEEFRDKLAAMFENLWEDSVRAMAYIGFLSEMLSPEELVLEYVRETSMSFATGVGAESRRRVLLALEQMAAADGDYSRIERDCIRALAKKCL